MRERRCTAEVRRLVPPVSRPRQSLDDDLEVHLHCVRLQRKLCPVRVGEARPRLRLELVTGEVLRSERQGSVEVGIEVGGGLARDPVDEVERDVVKSGITKMVEGASDGVRLGNALERGEQVRTKALRAEGHAVHPLFLQERREPGRHRLRVCLHCLLLGVRQRGQQPSKRVRLRERRRPAPDEDGLDLRGKQLALEPQLCEQCIDVASVLLAAADERDEVAVATTVRAERQVDVEVARATHFRSPLRLSTARNASWGTSTIPTCFIRFFPAFCRSRSLRLREMSPP